MSNSSPEKDMHLLIRSVALNMLINPLVTFGISIIIARTLGPDGRGSYGVLVAILTMFPILACLGLEYATRFFCANDAANSASLLKTMTLIGTGLGAVLSCVVIFLGQSLSRANFVFDQLGAFGLWALAITLLLVMICRFWNFYLTGKERYGYGTWGVTGSILLQGSVLLLGWQLGAISLNFAALSLALQALFHFVLFPVLSWQDVRTAVSSPLLSTGRLREMLRFGSWMYVGGTLGLANTHLIIFLLSGLAGLTETGLYAAVVGPANLLLLFSAPLGTVLATRATKRIGDKHFSIQVAAGLRVIFCMTTVAALFGLIVAPYLIPMIFGEEFGGAVGPFCWLLPGLVGMSLKRVIVQFLSGIGKPRWSTAISATNAFAGIAIAFILIPRFGANGAAVAITIAHILSTLLSLRAFWRFAQLGASELFVPRASDWRPLARVLGLNNTASAR